MTVCIALACEAENNAGARIVVCVDALNSSDLGSVDFYQKDRTLLGGWRCLTAGHTAEINALLPLLKAQFRGTEIDETNICTLVRAALAARKKEKADELTIGRWGMNYDEFLAARNKFPEAVFLRNLNDIESIPLQSDLIVTGFLSDGFPILVRAFGNDVAIEEDFATVGSGAFLANASLRQRNHMSGDSISAGLYHAYEAKKHAQRVPTVGTYTHLAVIQHGVPPLLVGPEGKAYLEDKFKKLGPKDLAKDPIVIPDDFYAAPLT